MATLTVAAAAVSSSLQTEKLHNWVLDRVLTKTATAAEEPPVAWSLPMVAALGSSSNNLLSLSPEGFLPAASLTW
jgi:hypothetical protein